MDQTRASAVLAACLPGVLLAAAGCASLPDARFVEERRFLRPVAIEGSRGPLSARQSARVIAALKAKAGDTDILQRHLAVEQEIAAKALVAGNAVQLLQDGPATYASMFDAMRAARDHINLETFIIEDDEVGNRFARILLDKQAEGVAVHLIYDSVGSLKTPEAFFERLRAGGVRVLEFNPVNPLLAREGWRLNNRDHRKLLIVDGRIAFVGGINISSVYSGHASAGSAPSARRASGPPDAPAIAWRDTHLRIEGPVVADFQALFLQTWAKQKGEAPAAAAFFPPLQPAGRELVRAVGSAPADGEGTIYLTLLSAINSAEKSIRMANAYFAPDPQLLEALMGAAQRGVEVSLILPGVTDSWVVFHAGRSHYADLLAAGVRIHEHEGALLHSKSAVIDGVWSCIGSTNLDWRSFLHNDEVNAVVLGREFARQMEEMFAQDLRASRPVEREEWAQRPLSLRLKEFAARLWEYWL